jgi:hypothetical protein
MADKPFNRIDEAIKAVVEEREENFVEASSIEAPGIVEDDYGHKWTIPADTHTDGSLQLYQSRFELPKRDPRFHYEFHPVSEVSHMMTEDFVPVTREELGLKGIEGLTEQIAKEYGAALTSFHQVDDLVCMKTPVELANRRYRALKEIADAAVNATRPGASGRDETLAGAYDRLKADNKNVKTSFELNRKTELGREPQKE